MLLWCRGVTHTYGTVKVSTMEELTEALYITDARYIVVQPGVYLILSCVLFGVLLSQMSVLRKYVFNVFRDITEQLHVVRSQYIVSNSVWNRMTKASSVPVTTAPDVFFVCDNASGFRFASQNGMLVLSVRGKRGNAMRGS